MASLLLTGGLMTLVGGVVGIKKYIEERNKELPKFDTYFLKDQPIESLDVKRFQTYKNIIQIYVNFLKDDRDMFYVLKSYKTKIESYEQFFLSIHDKSIEECVKRLIMEILDLNKLICDFLRNEKTNFEIKKKEHLIYVLQMQKRIFIDLP